MLFARMGDVSRKVVEFSEYWLCKAQSRRMPSFRDILPEDVFRMLPNMVLWRVIDDGGDFRCRVLGQSLMDNYGTDLKGRPLSDLVAENPSLAVFRANFLRSIATRRPLAVIDHFLSHHGTPKRTLGIVAPLSDDGLTVSDVICCGSYVQSFDFAEVGTRLSALFERIENVA